MDQRKATLLRSVLSLVAVVALGGGVTYALFTSNTVTLGATQVTTGNADLRICNTAGTNDWKDAINPALNVGDLVPNVEKQITNTGDIHLGNDNGTLASVFGDTRCDSYAVPAGSSDVAFKVNPQLPGPAVCTDGTLNDTLRLKFKIGDKTTSYKTLADWVGSTTDYTPTAFDPGTKVDIEMYAKLDADVVAEGATCTFDVTFTGEQV